MDWSKAKSILIVTFLILNLFLGAQLVQTMQQTSNLMETDNINREQVDQMMRENRITLSKDQNTSFPTSLVAYQANITPMGPEWKKDERGGYTREFPDAPVVRDFRDLEKFLKGTVPWFSEYKLSLSRGSRVVYNQLVEGRYIFDATLEVQLKSGNRVQSVRVVHYESVKLQPVELMTLDTALYHLLTNWSLKKGSVITSVDLGYRAKARGTGDESILVPYYRFRVENLNQDLFLNARTFKEVEAEPRDQETEEKGTRQP
ncbi:two-component system regulatory protein YycI [Staphylospora marina]|uniref:two-component system regulatory protein YycI n=1 Tax=Staphylospora marina TaxID=2490858 RepID=UPI000F5B8B03|nr:two-component system regulatory protein YycI [Staphylospora marina]